MRTSLTILLIAIMISAYGQKADSSRAGKDPDSVSFTQPAVPGQQSPDLKHSVPFSEDNAVKLQREEVPAFMLKALQDERFRGWENGAVYRNVQTNEYRVEVVNGMNRDTFYFDKNGELILAK